MWNYDADIISAPCSFSRLSIVPMWNYDLPPNMYCFPCLMLSIVPMWNCARRDKACHVSTICAKQTNGYGLRNWLPYVEFAFKRPVRDGIWVATDQRPNAPVPSGTGYAGIEAMPGPTLRTYGTLHFRGRCFLPIWDPSGTIGHVVFSGNVF